MNEIKKAYNTAAHAYRKRYDAVPARVEDIEFTLSYIRTDNPFVVEIGCAYGREARYLLNKISRYIGIDICDEYIHMAQTEVVGGEFICADVLEYEFPKGIDVVFAFASLLHLPKDEIALVLQKVARALSVGGLVFLSLKRRDSYEAEMITDDVVSRQFYYYNRETITDVLPVGLVEVFYAEQNRNESWFTIILQKQ
jgi:SAM-dependent methyltransferase